MNGWRFLLKMLNVWVYAFLLTIMSAQAQQQSAYDWSTPRLIPVEVKIAENKIILKAGGESVEFAGQLFKLDAGGKLSSTWSKEGHELVTFSLKIRAAEDAVLRNVKWFSGQWKKYTQLQIHSTHLMDNMLFLRKNGVSFFLSLDFPYSRIDDACIQYPPHILIKKDSVYEAHSLTIGACKLSGEKVGKYDRAEIEAASCYVEKRYPSRFQRPVVLSSGITNRMTDVRDNRIFYSMYDNPTIALSPYLVAEDLKLNAELGVEYYQAFEGGFDWPDEQQTGEHLRKLQELAKPLGVRMGDYAVPQGLYCPHYNYYHRKLDRADWLIKDKDGRPGAECLGVREYVNMLTERVVAHDRKYGLQLICLDFLNIQPCYAADHGHPPGDVYRQIKGLVDFLKALNDIDKDFLVWSNSGNWIDLMPKLVWYNPNVYLTDPHVRQYAPHLNVLKNLGDGRREQMVSVHEQYFVPYANFTNYEYYLSPNSRLSDTKVFEYSFLQGLAVTPNLGLGEIRSFFNRIPGKDEAHLKKFIRFWLDFIRKHYDVWKHTIRLGDVPGLGAAEVYAHIKGDSGFLCFVNQNAFPVSKQLVINGSAGLTKGEAFLLTEVYPGRGPIAEQSLPYASWNDTISFTLAPFSVRIVEITAKRKMDYPVIYGAEPVEIEKNKNGYMVTLSIPQGITKQLGVVLQPDQYIIEVAASQKPTVPMYTFPVSAKLVERRGNAACIEVKGPREGAPAALTYWRVNGDSLCSEFPPPGRKGFLGGYVHNAFSENYLVRLEIKVAQGKAVRGGEIFSYKAATPSLSTIPSPTIGTVTYTTQFTLPFIERYGQDRDTRDDAIVELGFSDPKAVTIQGVWLNGKEVPAMVFKNAKNPEHITHYIELKGNIQPGLVELKAVVAYKK